MPINVIGSGAWNKKPIPLTLPAGGIYVLPAGQYMVIPGPYTFLQWYDSVATIWRTAMAPLNSHCQVVSADGYNFRIANLTGCMIGAYLTNGGSGYPNGIYPAGTAAAGSYVQATSSAGTATWNVVVGGCINTSVTITTAGVGYNNPPTLTFSDPPTGGVKASAIATVSGGAVSGVTVINQGAGYSAAPTITVTPHPLDLPAPGQTNVGTPAVLTAALTNSGRVTAVTIGGNLGAGAYTSVPSINFAQSAGSSAAATAIACFTITGLTAPTGGSANQTAAVMVPTSAIIASAKTNAPVNPWTEQNLFIPRAGQVTSTLASGVASALAITDGGLHQSATVSQVTMSAWATAAPTSSISGTAAFGGVTDTTTIIPI